MKKLAIICLIWFIGMILVVDCTQNQPKYVFTVKVTYCDKREPIIKQIVEDADWNYSHISTYEQAVPVWYNKSEINVCEIELLNKQKYYEKAIQVRGSKFIGSPKSIFVSTNDKKGE